MTTLRSTCPPLVSTGSPPQVRVGECMGEREEGGRCMSIFIHVVVRRCTVEPHLTNTPQQWTPMIQWTILKVLTVLPCTLILKQPLNSRHPATPYNGQLSWPQLYATILNDLDLADTCRPFHQDCAVVYNLTLN